MGHLEKGWKLLEDSAGKIVHIETHGAETVVGRDTTTPIPCLLSVSLPWCQDPERRRGNHWISLFLFHMWAHGLYLLLLLFMISLAPLIGLLRLDG